MANIPSADVVRLYSAKSQRAIPLSFILVTNYVSTVEDLNQVIWGKAIETSLMTAYHISTIPVIFLQTKPLTVHPKNRAHAFSSEKATVV